jgi:ubiquinone/menaquinone biosynthesis C-methylase UbiE
MSIDKLYSTIAKVYDLELYLNGSKRAVDFFVKQLPFPEKKRIKVLDAGAGTGLFTLAILKRFPNAQVVAFDLNEDMLEELRINLTKKRFANSVKTFISDLSKPIPEIINTKFDLIITGGVLEYVNPEDAIRNLASYLKPGGIFFNSPMKDNIWGKLVGLGFKFKPYSKERNIQAFTNNGFILLKSLKLKMKYFPASLIKEGYIFKKIT